MSPDAELLKAHFRSASGTQFDPAVIEVLLEARPVLTGPPESSKHP